MKNFFKLNSFRVQSRASKPAFSCMAINLIFSMVLSLAFCLALSLTFFSCSKKAQTFFAEESLDNGTPVISMRAAKQAAAPAMADMEMAVEDAADFDAASVSGTAALAEVGAGNASAAIERKLIKSGSVSLEVSDLNGATDAAALWVKNFGGYIENNFLSEQNASIRARIPSGRFDEAMEAAGNLGRVLNKNTSVSDVSEQFYDLQTRLETKKIMRERLSGYLRTAASVKDMLQIERELNSVVSEIESMEGRMRRLGGQIDFSSINIDMSLPFRADNSHSFVWPDLGNGAREFFSNVVDFFGGFIAFVLYFVLYGALIIAALAFFFWLLFGKVGILRRLYKRLK